MALRITFILSLLLLYLPVYGQSSPQESKLWQEYNAKMMRITQRDFDPLIRRRVFDSLKVDLALELQRGPVTEFLAYRYHWMSLRLKHYFLAEVKPYADTAIVLRIQVSAPTADIAQSHYEKGRVVRLFGNYQEAMIFLDEGTRIMSQAIIELDSTPDLAKRQAYFLKESAITAARAGNFELARLRVKLIPSLLKIDTSLTSKNTAFEVEMMKGRIEGLAGNYELSIEYFRQAMKMDYFKKTSQVNQGALRGNLGRRLFWIGHYDEAERELAAAKLLAQNAENWFNVSINDINIMDMRVRQKRPQEALDLLDIAESNAMKIEGSGKGEVFGELYLYAAQAAEQLGRTKQLEALLAKSAMALLANNQLNGPAQLPRIEGNTIYGQPVLLQFLDTKRDIFLNAYLRSNDTDDLLLAHATSHSIDTLMRLNRDQLNLTASLGQFLNKEAEQYTAAVDIALQLYRKTGQATYLNEAYQFVTGQKSNLLRRYLTSPGLAGTLGVPDEVVEEKKELDLQVLIVERALRNASGAEETVLRDSILRLNFQTSRLKEEIADDYPAFSKALRGYTAINPAAAAATMADDQLIVEYFLATDSIYAFTLSKTDGLGVLTVPRPDNLTERIGTVVDQGAGATSLYELLVAPVLEGRPAITRLQFIPDGELWKIPFAALKNGNDFLINDYAVSFAYAAPLLFDRQLADQARAQEEEYLGYGISYESLQQDLSGSGLRSADYRDLRAMGQLPLRCQHKLRVFYSKVVAPHDSTKVAHSLHKGDRSWLATTMIS